jgi:hypothetical protein
MNPELKRKAGHYEILGETLAKFEFFQQGWNPYSRFLDVDKVDLILRRSAKGRPTYREIQVKFGKLYPVKPAWERRLFDVTSWRFFKVNEFASSPDHLFLAYSLSRDDQYAQDFFIFPIRVFEELIGRTPIAGGKHRVYISRSKDEPHPWLLRLQSSFTEVVSQTCLDVTRYRRAFDLLEPDA